jgi:phage terminase large subunit GpA-like protein
MSETHLSAEIRQGFLSAAGEAMRRLTPPPRLSVAEWADKTRMLDSQSSAEPGRWYTSRAEYQRGIMDACSDPAVKEVVVMCGTQSGKSEALLNTIGYHMHHDPCPILMMQPTVDMAQAFSKDRVTAGLINPTPALRGLVKDPKARDASNTTLHKVFPGGALSLVGANSPSSLASRPIRVVLCDEVDRYPPSAGEEGDPISLAKRRSATFWNRKIIQVSTPTNKSASRIESAYEESDRREFYVPCPHCDEKQTLVWEQVQWQEGNPKTAQYFCEHCGGAWTEPERHRAVSKGEWIASEPFNGVAGFHFNALYSPWVDLVETVEEFLNSKRDPMRLKTFVNTILAETWEEQGDGVDENDAMRLREEYEEMPEGVVLLTAGVDVQDDRLEAEIVGWGAGEESWQIKYQVIYGDPSAPTVWARLDEFLFQTFEHPAGRDLVVRSTCVDSGGHHTRAVYNYAKTRSGRNVFAIKGVGGEGKAIVGRPSKNNIGKVPLYPVGVDTAKELHYSRLKIDGHGAGYCHFREEMDDEYFRQLTAEKRVVRYHKGYPKNEWKKTRTRNEALDVRVYAIAALSILNVNMDSVARRFYDSLGGEAAKRATKKKEKPHPLANQANIRQRKGGFANSWR